MVKFTPGPWVIRPHRVSRVHDRVTSWLLHLDYNNEDEAIDRDDTWGEIYGAGECTPEMEANARLIAAAPDMYEALIEISQLSAGGPHTSAADGFNAVWHTLNKAREIADAALSKATGEDND